MGMVPDRASRKAEDQEEALKLLHTVAPDHRTYHCSQNTSIEIPAFHRITPQPRWAIFRMTRIVNDARNQTHTRANSTAEACRS